MPLCIVWIVVWLLIALEWIWGHPLYSGVDWPKGFEGERQDPADSLVDWEANLD